MSFPHVPFGFGAGSPYRAAYIAGRTFVEGMIGEKRGESTDRGTAKVYYADGEATELDAAFIVEGLDWIVGFDQANTDGSDYVSIPASRAIGVRSSLYCSFRERGKRVTAYGADREGAEEYFDRLPL